MVKFEKLTSNTEVLKAISDVKTIRQRMMKGTHNKIDTVLLARRLELISKSMNGKRIMQMLFV
jgi:hypothetical protein